DPTARPAAGQEAWAYADSDKAIVALSGRIRIAARGPKGIQDARTPGDRRATHAAEAPTARLIETRRRGSASQHGDHPRKSVDGIRSMRAQLVVTRSGDRDAERDAPVQHVACGRGPAVCAGSVADAQVDGSVQRDRAHAIRRTDGQGEYLACRHRG